MVITAKQATVRLKLVAELERHAHCCPPTLHNTKLDQLNKASVKGGGGLVHSAHVFLNLVHSAAQLCGKTIIQTSVQAVVFLSESSFSH